MVYHPLVRRSRSVGVRKKLERDPKKLFYSCFYSGSISLFGCCLGLSVPLAGELIADFGCSLTVWGLLAPTNFWLISMR